MRLLLFAGLVVSTAVNLTLECLATGGASHGSKVGDVGHDVAHKETTDLSFVLAGALKAFWLVSLCCSGLADMCHDVGQ
jgi:hypothetical protein